MSLIGDLLLRIGVDSASWNELSSTLDEGKAQVADFAAQAETSGATLDAAFSSMADSAGLATPGLGELSAAMGGTASIADASAGSFDAAGLSMDQVGGAANRSAPQVHELGQEAEEATAKFEGFGEGLLQVAEILGVGLGMAEAIESLKELASESLEAFGKLQMVTVGLTSLTGSAEVAEEVLAKIKEIALGSIFSFPDLAQAAQKMAVLGVNAEAIPDALKAVAGAAELTGNSLQGVAGALDRVYLSATVQSRTLSQLGISTKELGDVMGVTADQVAKAFKDLGPQSERGLQAVVEAIQRKTAEAAAAMQDTLPVAINRVKVEWDSLLEDFGKEVAPDIATFLGLLEALLPPLEKALALLTGVAATQLSELLGAFRLLYQTVSELAAPLEQVASLLKIDWGSLTSNLVNYLTGWQTIKVAIIDSIAALDVWRGKYPDIVTAITALNAQLTNQKTATDASKTATVDHTAAIQKAVAAAMAHADALKNAGEKMKQYTDLADPGPLLKFVDAQDKANAVLQGAVAEFPALVAAGIPATLLFGELEKLAKAAGVSEDELRAATGVLAPELNSLPDSLNAIALAADKFTSGMSAAAEELDTFSNIGRNMADPVAAGIQQITDEAAKARAEFERWLQVYNQLAETGLATEEELADALAKVESAANKAGVEIDQVGAVADKTKQRGVDMATQINSAIERDLSKALGDAIFGTGKLSDAFVKLGQDVVDIVLNHIIKDALKPLLDTLDQVLGKLLGIFGGGSSGGGVLGTTVGAAGGAAQSGAGAAGGGVASAAGAGVSGVTGILTSVFTGISAISGIFGNFQNAQQETTLNAIELNTRQTAMFIGGLGGHGVQDWLQDIDIHVTNLEGAFNGWFHDAMSTLMSTVEQIRGVSAKGIVGAAPSVVATAQAVTGAPVSMTNHFHITTNDPGQMTRAIERHLKSLSPKFSI